MRTAWRTQKITGTEQTCMNTTYHLNYLEQLEAESIHIFREVAAQFEKPALLFSGGKDSICLVHLAQKAFAPGKIPFPLVHIDTGHNFPEALDFRDAMAASIGATLVVRKVEDTIKQRSLTEPRGKFPSRNWLQTYTLLDTIEEFGFDCCIGGARRDEEKARAKERIFSVRDEFGQWNPKLQRPELWNTYNGKIHNGENVRVFPISNWTELDIWNYIRHEKIDLPSIYFAHERKVIEHEGQLVAISEFVHPDEQDVVMTKRVRYRTVGDMTCTAAVESTADTLDEVINEIISTRISERGETRIDDKVTEAAMEDRKKNGYF
ncbi:MAG TPA: sulfate adenylyltransferase subunit CysD [Chitinophagaceae bacterium]|nr:sulfate adenylyltransferase subunit CysD [Chitinophagaceae bacterium]